MSLISPKTRYIVLPSCEDVIMLRSFILTQYRSVTDRQTETRNTRTAVMSWLHVK